MWENFKKNKPQEVIFYIFFLVGFFLEGLGLPFGRQTTLLLIQLIPLILISMDLLAGVKINISKNIGVLYALFLIFSTISFLFSVDPQNSFNFLLMYISLFPLLIFVSSHSKFIKKIILNTLLKVSVVYCAFSLMLPLFISFHFTNLVPIDGYQFVYSRYGSHNHLGDFLVLSLIISLYKYLKSKKKKYLILSAIFIPFFLFSYSRSGYLAGVLGLSTLMVTSIKKRALTLLSAVGLSLFSLILILLLSISITTNEVTQISQLRPFYQVLTEDFGLKYKYFKAKRLVYINQAFLSIKEEPFFGTGPNNFIYSSRRFASPNSATYSSHNIFLDIWAENGIFAFIVFLVLILKTIKNGLNHFSLFFIMFISMLTNFQTDYTFHIYTFYLLFIILLGLVSQEAKIEKKL